MSRLFALSGELRNRIYKLILVKEEPVRPQFKEDRMAERDPLNFLAMCKRIRDEAAPIYYGDNVFKFYATKSCLQDFQIWARAISSNRAILEAIKDLSIQGCVWLESEPDALGLLCSHTFHYVDYNMDFVRCVAKIPEYTPCCMTSTENAVLRHRRRGSYTFQERMQYLEACIPQILGAEEIESRFSLLMSMVTDLFDWFCYPHVDLSLAEGKWTYILDLYDIPRPSSQSKVERSPTTNQDG